MKSKLMYLLLTLVLVSTNAYCFPSFSDFGRHGQEKRNYIQGCKLSFDSESHSFGLVWGKIEKKDKECNVCGLDKNENMWVNYVEGVAYDKENTWKNNGLSQLGDYGIAVGFTTTLFGHTGFQPTLGWRTINLKKGGLQLGAAWMSKDTSLYRCFINTYYDFITERVGVSLVCYR